MFIKVNGINLFYEKKGEGRPIILLHGNGESHDIFDVLLKKLSRSYTVYAVDTRDHGQSDKVKDINYEAITEDIKCFIKKLKLENPMLCGFSDGGIVGIMLASKYPCILSKLVICGANINPKGLKNKYQVLFKIWYFCTRSSKVKMMITEPDISYNELKRIKIPVLVLAGSKDVIKEKHTKSISRNIRNSTLKIVSGESHESYVIHSPKLFKLINTFINNSQ